MRLTPELYKKLETRAAQLIRQEILDTLAVCQEHNVDAFELAEDFRAAYPREWSRQMWDSEFHYMPVEVQVKVSLRKSGLLW